ncbi:MAG: zinc ribbon domain-containing protein [Candidatus Thorarchaeota archaeon]
MKQYKFCPQCGGRVRPQAKFCNHCGVSLKRQKSIVEPQQQRSQAISAPTPSEKGKGAFPGEPESVQVHLVHMDQQLRNIQGEIRKITQEYYRCRQICIREQSEVDELKKLSWASFSAKLKGNSKEKLKAEEMDVVRALAKEKLVLDQLQELRKTEMELNEEREQLRQKLVALRKRVVPPAISEVDKKQIISRSKLEDDLADLNAGRDFLHKAQLDLEKAINELRSAQTAFTVDMAGEGSVITDMIERGHISNAQHSVSKAEAHIRQARLRIGSVTLPTRIETPLLVLDAFLDSLFADFLSHQKIEEGRTRCEESRNNLISTIKQVDHSINSLQRQIAEVDKDSEVVVIEDIPATDEIEAMAPTEETPPPLQEEALDIPETEITAVTADEKSIIENATAEPEEAIAANLLESSEDDFSQETTEESAVIIEEPLGAESTERTLPEVFLEDLRGLRYRFKTLEISEAKEKAIATFFSDKPQEMRWTKGEEEVFIVDSDGRISVNWNTKLDFQIDHMEKFDWSTPYEGVTISCEDSQVEQRIRRTSRIAEKLRTNSLLLKVHIEVLDRQIRVKLIFSEIPDVRDSVDLTRDLILALELVRR